MGSTGTNRRTISLGFSAELMPEGQHICYLYNDDAERLSVMSRYMESGQAAGEKLLYLVDNMTPEEMTACLESMGVDVRSKPADVTVADATAAYCPSGVFNCEEMLAAVREFYLTAMAEGCPGARGTGEMSWCLVDGLADEESLMEYEAKLNLLIAEHPYTACCQYDTRRLDGPTIMDVLAVHPMVIMRGQLVRNPYFQPPEQFLASLRERAGGMVS